MHEISAEMVRAAFAYDPLTGIMMWSAPNKHHSERKGLEAGSPQFSNGKPYHVIQFNGKKYRRGRLAYMWMTGEFPPAMIDHISGDSLDDRWANLRAATALENSQNQRGRVKRSNLPMGIRKLPSGRFCARIRDQHKLVTLGTFTVLEDAVSAYQTARKRLFGEFDGL